MIEIKSIKLIKLGKFWQIDMVDEHGQETFETIYAIDYEDASLKAKNIIYRLNKKGLKNDSINGTS